MLISGFCIIEYNFWIKYNTLSTFNKNKPQMNESFKYRKIIGRKYIVIFLLIGL